MIVATTLLILSYYPLNFIPYAVSAPSLGVLAFGLALMTGDGYLALFGYLMVAATIVVGIIALTGGFGGEMEAGGGFWARPAAGGARPPSTCHRSAWSAPA